MNVVVGAGIGGLTLANALRHRGIEATVLERAPSLRDGGAGITLQPNALALLDRLGLVDPLREHGVDIGFQVQRADGLELARNTLPREVTGGFGTLGIARRPLSRVLADHAEAPPRFDARVVAVGQDADGATVTLEDGTTVSGDVVVGADGIHSAVRTAVFGPMEPRYNGYTCWRGLVPRSSGLPDGVAVERWGRGRRFGIVPVGPDLTYWFATLNAPAGGEDGPDIIEELLGIFADFAAPTPELLRATPAVLRNDIIDLPPLDRWVDGRIALLGDAAHAMTPNMGQGACQAIEDAVALADALASGTDPVRALRTYESSRLPRARWFVQNSEQFGRIGQWEAPAAVFARDLLTRWTPAFVQEPTLRKAWVLSNG